MLTCQQFLAAHSDLRDGYVELPLRAALEQHLRDCARCARYDRVLREGIAVIREAPELEASEDFLPRMQHRLYHVDEELRGPRRDGSGIAPALAVAVAAVVAALGAMPVARGRPEPPRLPAVAAQAPLPRSPARAEAFQPEAFPVSAGFGQEWSATGRDPSTLLFRYSPLGRGAAQPVSFLFTPAP